MLSAFAWLIMRMNHFILNCPLMFFILWMRLPNFMNILFAVLCIIMLKRRLGALGLFVIYRWLWVNSDDHSFDALFSCLSFFVFYTFLLAFGRCISV